MESKKITENISDLAGSVKDYLFLQLDLAKLMIAEKLSRIITAVIVIVIMFIMFLFFMTFLSFAFVFWFRDNGGEAYLGALIVAGFYLVVAVIIYMLRTALFINPLVLQITKILLEKKDETK